MNSAPHRYSLGTVVEVDLDLSQPGADDGIEINLSGTCKLFVVGQTFDTDGNPQYIVSDLPVRFPADPAGDFTHPSRMEYRSHATIVEHGLDEASLRPTGVDRMLHSSLHAWLQRAS